MCALATVSPGITAVTVYYDRQRHCSVMASFLRRCTSLSGGCCPLMFLTQRIRRRIRFVLNVRKSSALVPPALGGLRGASADVGTSYAR